MDLINFDLVELLMPAVGFIFLLFISFFFLKEWQTGRRRDYEMRKMEFDLKREEVTDSTKIKINNEVPGAGGDLGGYITVEIPEERKPMFQDILKGFEEYSLLKGYKVTISIDTSESNRISFKITILDFGVTANRNSVKQDLNEYIHKIQTGDIDDDIPQVINPIDHSRVVMALRNRITFLQQNYEVEKNIKEFYEGFVKNLPVSGFSHGNPIFHISNGGSTDMDQRKYISNNSANVMQGDNHKNQVEAVNINIGSTVNEKNAQADLLNDLIKELSQASDNEEYNKAIRHCESVKDEILDEAEPDEGMISKLLGKVGGILNTAEKGSDLFEKAQNVFSSFGV